MTNMNLSRGNCILCTNCNKIVNPPGASSITKLLPHVLEGLIDDQKLGSVTFETLKICPLCLQDILFILEHKPHIKDHSETSNNCNVCLCDNNLVFVRNWNHFETIIGTILRIEKQKCYIICLKCMKYLETLDRIKTNFIIKNPQLRLQESPKKRNTKDSSKESHPTPNKKRLSIITHSNGANHDGDLEKALRHLKPLQLLNFDLDQFEKDEKLLNQIAFVKLQSLKAAHKHRSKINGMSDDNSHLSMNSESKHHSFFKIKLKMKPSFKTKRITKVSPKKIQQATVDPVKLSGKELSVKLLKMDLNKKTEEHLFTSTVRRSTALTPTKASLKFIEEPLSSSKKRKSVTFAPCLNDVSDEVDIKEENTGQSPLKPSSDLCEQTEWANEENGMVSTNKDIDNSDNYVDSDEDDINNRLDPFTEHLKNNSDSIFESLKSNGVQNSNGFQNTILDKDNDSDSATITIENCSSNKDVDISEQNNAENSDQNASDMQVEIRNDSENNKSQDVSEANEVEMKSTVDDESSKNALTDDSQDNQESNEENSSNEGQANTRKRKLSDDLSVPLKLDSNLEPEAKRLKIGEEETINSKDLEDVVTEDDCVAKSEDIIEEVTATIVLDSQEDTCNENGKNTDISETDLDLRATEI